MGNHIHLLIKPEKEPLEQVFIRIGGRYVYWYNVKYQRVGHLFQDRFKSELVENDSYFLTVIRYIHQNPVKAGLCKNIKHKGTVLLSNTRGRFFCQTQGDGSSVLLKSLDKYWISYIL